MKNIMKFYFTWVIVLLFPIIANAQLQHTISAAWSDARTVKKNYINGSFSSWSNAASQWVGKSVTGNNYSLGRAYVKFAFTIPAASRISSATLTINPQSNGVRTNIYDKGTNVDLWTNSSYDKPDMYNGASSGTSVGWCYLHESKSFNVKPNVENAKSAGNITFSFVGNETENYWESVSVSLSITYEDRAQFTVMNEPNEGIVYINGGVDNNGNSINGNKQSGQVVNQYPNENVSISAIQQTMSDNYYHVWNTTFPTNPSDWQRGTIGNFSRVTTSQSHNISVSDADNGKIYLAKLPKQCNATFQSYGGVKINGTNYSSPQTRQIVEGNTITAEITQSSYQSNYLKYKFDHWSTGSTSPSITLTVNNTQTVSAIYKGYATTKNVHFINIIPGQPICLDWDTHDNAGVTQYKVWRYPKYGATTCIATLGSSVTSFTDYEYVYSTGSPDATVMFYSVTAYYSPDQTWGEQVWINTSGEESDRSILTTENTATITEAAEQDIIPEYKLSNSPNPFNPTTQIHYSLPETEQVTIKVFNMLGKEVTELVNAVQRKGEHVVTFNADNLSSGVYIYTIQTPHYTASKKMILMK